MREEPAGVLFDAWASARKPYSDVDVAAASGWKDIATMKRSYQKADPVSVLKVVIAQAND